MRESIQPCLSEDKQYVAFGLATLLIRPSVLAGLLWVLGRGTLMAHGLYHYLREMRKQRHDIPELAELWKRRIMEWRHQPSVVRIEKYT